MTVGERTEVVLQLLRREDTAKHLMRHAEVSEKTLYRWREEFIRTDCGAFNSKACHSSVLQAELQIKEQRLAERDLWLGELTVADRV